jgi:threonine dehydrogenase-like Zn-dependent dehydrogenase
VLGPGTIGLLAAVFARAAGAEVHLMGRSEMSFGFARSLGFEHAWTADNLPGLPFDAVIDASNARHLPGLDVVLDVNVTGIARVTRAASAPLPDYHDSTRRRRLNRP